MQQLKEFQIEGAVFLSERTRALLADEPGVGKTPQLITAVRLVEAKSVCVVCPSIAMEHWLRELKKWGVPKGTLVSILSWDAVQRSPRPGFMWDVLIVDECHFGKNPVALRTRAMFAKGGLAHYARRIWAASGTPAPNDVTELWPMLRAFGKIGMDFDQFKNYFCRVDDQGKIRGNRPERIDELRAILKSFSLRRLKKDVLPELGKIDIQEWYVKPDPAFAIGFQELGMPQKEENLRKQLAGKSAEDLLIFLAGDQEFATLRRYNALLKAPAVFETVKFELDNDLLNRVVIFGYHVEAMAALHGAFRRAKIDSTIIYGDTPKAERDGLIEAWKKKDKAPLIASIIIANTALDFTAAHQGIALELDWTPGNNKQAFERMHRFGQTNPVSMRVAMGTPIDELYSGVLMRKVKQLAEVFD